MTNTLYKKSSKNEFYQYLGEAVDHYKRKIGYTNKDLAIQMDVNESFIKNANRGERHYNSFHLWKLANILEISVEKLMPPINNFDNYKEIRFSSTEQDYRLFLKKLYE